MLPLVSKILNTLCDCDLTEEQYLMIFFLVSKSEHDNEDPSRTFLCADNLPVFLYCEALKYDYTDRGCTLGVVGFTTADSGKMPGDAQPVLRRLFELGGPNLLDLADHCHSDKRAADTLCVKIRGLNDDECNLMIRAQLEALAGDGYFGQTIRIIRDLGLPLKPLLVASIFDSLLNFGRGGKYCPLKFLRKHGVPGSKTKTLRALLKWKRKAGCKNDHNSCRSNAHNRSDMFKRLMRHKIWDLDEAWCKKVTKWTMK